MKTLGECVGFARIGNGIPSNSTQMNLPLIKKTIKKKTPKDQNMPTSYCCFANYYYAV